MTSTVNSILRIDIYEMSIRIELLTLTGTKYYININENDKILDFPKLVRNFHFHGQTIGFKFVYKQTRLLPTIQTWYSQCCCSVNKQITMGDFFQNVDNTMSLKNIYRLHMILCPAKTVDTDS